MENVIESHEQRINFGNCYLEMDVMFTDSVPNLNVNQPLGVRMSGIRNSLSISTSPLSGS